MPYITEREQWAHKLSGWQEQIRGYELDDVFELARMAMEEGDDEP